MAVLSHFWGFFHVCLSYKLEKSPYFPFTLWPVFGSFVTCSLFGRKRLCKSVKKQLLFFWGVVGLVQLSSFPFFGAEFFSLFPPAPGRFPFLAQGISLYSLSLRCSGKALGELSQGFRASVAPQNPAQFPHRVSGQAAAVFLAVGVQHRAGSQRRPEGRRLPADSRTLGQCGAHFQVIGAPVQAERRFHLGESLIQRRGGAAQGRCPWESENKGLRRSFQSQWQHLAWFFYSILWRLLGWGVGSFQSPWSMAMARAGLSARNTPVPAMSTSAPACRHRGAVSRFTPPSTLMSSRGNRFFSSRIFSRGAL